MAEQVRDAVSDYIREHGLKAGDRIPTEAELCAAFGLSRPSVREALRLLEQERLVVTVHGRGRFVTAVAALNVARPISVFESITKMLAALGYAANTLLLAPR
ncbi:GntR family transcriptional regulator [Cypionkella aquatica]|nr:GntR family transcriptional regulator [Cypionkella aquatica]